MMHCTCEKKTDRRCNNCGQRLTENSPNWFQCSEACRAAVWERNNPPKIDDDWDYLPVGDD